MLIIGESINGTIPKVSQAILNKDETFIKELAKVQVRFGAQMLDVNAGVGGSNEVENIVWAVEVVQKEVTVPLMIDSSNVQAIKAALTVYQHEEKPIINSITAEREKLEALLPVVAKWKCKIVALCMGDQGIPESVEERLRLATILFEELTAVSISPKDIYFDPLVLSAGINPEASMVTFETLKLIKERFPESHTICGISNAGMGLPGRKLINRVFMVLAVASGLDTVFIDVRDRSLISSLYAAMLLTNQDPYALNYTNAFREKKLEV